MVKAANEGLDRADVVLCCLVMDGGIAFAILLVCQVKSCCSAVLEKVGEREVMGKCVVVLPQGNVTASKGDGLCSSFAFVGVLSSS